MKDYIELNKQTYNELAEEYFARLVKYDIFYHIVGEKICETIFNIDDIKMKLKSGQGIRVLELGCGPGAILQALKNYPRVKAYAVDFSDRMVFFAKKSNEEAIIKDIDIALEYGYNGIRKHQKVEDERFLYWCDVKGVLVWSEMANCYVFNDKSIQNFTEQWIKVVKQNYNHPSIITWVPINESWGLPNIAKDKKQQNFANSLYYITKSLDNTRPVISNDGWEHTISDIITIHDYKQDGELLYSEYMDKERKVLNNVKEYNSHHKLFAEGYRYTGQPVIMSEYGGTALNSEKGWGYGNQVKDEMDFVERFYELTDVVKNIPYMTGYCYTQLTDVQQEINGLVDENRKDKFSDEVKKKIKEINEN